MNTNRDKSTASRSKNTAGRAYQSIPIGQVLGSKGEECSTLNKKLTSDLLGIYNKIKLSSLELENRKKVFNGFYRALGKSGEYSVESHGSFKTRTMIYDSDIDITVFTKKGKGISNLLYKQHANTILTRINNLLSTSNLTVGPIIHVKVARVPVIRCVDRFYNCKVDIVVDQYEGVEGSEFVIKSLEKYPDLKYLVILLKYFLKKRQLADVARGGLCSYGQFLILVNFVQLHPLIQNGAVNIKENLGTLFMDFFQLYGCEFPFENAIISVRNEGYMPNREAQINIENPQKPGHNVAAGCTSLPVIRDVFRFSYELMRAAFNEKIDSKKAIGELWIKFDEVNRLKKSKAHLNNKGAMKDR